MGCGGWTLPVNEVTPTVVSIQKNLGDQFLILTPSVGVCAAKPIIPYYLDYKLINTYLRTVANCNLDSVFNFHVTTLLYFLATCSLSL